MGKRKMEGIRLVCLVFFCASAACVASGLCTFGCVVGVLALIFQLSQLVSWNVVGRLLVCCACLVLPCLLTNEQHSNIRPSF